MYMYIYTKNCTNATSYRQPNPVYPILSFSTKPFLSYPNLSYLTLPYPTLPYPILTLPYPTPYPTLPDPTLPYSILPYPILPYPILTLPYPTPYLPYIILPYPTLPYLILTRQLCLSFDISDQIANYKSIVVIATEPLVTAEHRQVSCVHIPNFHLEKINSGLFINSDKFV